MVSIEAFGLYFVKRGLWPRKSKRLSRLKESHESTDEVIKTGCRKV
jgi:hypothetical protein